MVERSGKDTAYLHQSDAIERLLGADTGPVVVTTGTGSGKTECFLLPVLKNAIEDAVRFGRRGLTAIYVDGAAFHRGAALRRDRYIRQRLLTGNPPWKVVELRAKYLKLGEGLLRMINS
jgi:DEAD/DEAH box helicase